MTVDDNNADDDEDENISGRLNPKFQPQDFNKMTSVEVIEILKNSVLFDARKDHTNTESTIFFYLKAIHRLRLIIDLLLNLNYVKFL